jgi:uncharacterized membrane protein
MTVNVPMNEELARVALAGTDLAAVRADYEPAWNRANTLRTGPSVAAFALLVGPWPATAATGSS